jgi:hypothetical protein
LFANKITPFVDVRGFLDNVRFLGYVLQCCYYHYVRQFCWFRFSALILGFIIFAISFPNPRYRMNAETNGLIKFMYNYVRCSTSLLLEDRKDAETAYTQTHRQIYQQLWGGG